MKLLLILLSFFMTIQERYASWKTDFSKDKSEIILTAEIKDGWYIYGSKLDVKGPLVTKIEWEPSKDYKIVGNLEAVNPKRKHDEIWGGNIYYFEKTALFKQKVKLLKPNAVVKGTIKYQACINDPEDGSCINEAIPFTIKI